VNDWIDVGVFTRASGDSEEKEKVLYLQRHHVTAETKSLTVVVDEQPYEVGVDPYNKLIDRTPDDNRKTVD
jgi:ABC-2 type transport system permease protein